MVFLLFLQGVMPTHNKSDALATGRKYCRFHEEYHEATHEFWTARRNVYDGLGKCKLAESFKQAKRLENPDHKARRNKRNVAYHMRRMQTDSLYALKVNLRVRLNRFLKQSGVKKSASAIRDLGCSVQELKLHIEQKFFPNPRTGEPMTWENHTITGWHVDHVVPLCSVQTPEGLKKLCHFTNLAPLWQKENSAKGGVM